MRSRRAVFALGVLVFGAATTRAHAVPSQTLEYEVKAAYIFNLANASEWPTTAFRSQSEPFHVCVADPNPFGALLAQTFQNELVAGHPVVVTPISSPQVLPSCHMLFVGESADESGALVKAAAGVPILTVGEGRMFARRGGIITFVLDEGRIRFDVNQQAAARAGIRLSSKVLRVARKVS